MNEWELTPGQVLDVVKQSGVRCSVDTIEHKCKGTMTDYCTYAAEDAARAAQRRLWRALTDTSHSTEVRDITVDAKTYWAVLAALGVE